MARGNWPIVIGLPLVGVVACTVFVGVPEPGIETCMSEARARIRPYRQDYEVLARELCDNVQELTRDNRDARRDLIEAGVILAGGR